MTKRGAIWGAGLGVVLAAVSSVLINKLDAGWPWWVASAVVVLASAGIAMWQTSGAGESAEPLSPGIKSDLQVGEVEGGKVTNIRADKLDGGSINAKTRADTVRGGGSLTGIELGTIRRDPDGER
jgi:hypothetical protein